MDENEIRDLLVKSASLCRQAAQKLRDTSSPTKEASEIVASMISKGLLDPSSKDQYAATLAVSGREELGKLASAISVLPTKNAHDLGDVELDSAPSFDAQTNPEMQKMSAAASNKLDSFLFN